MLIVDESEVMKNNFLKEFKNLRTATEDLLSIVIVGITEVESTLHALQDSTHTHGFQQEKTATATLHLHAA
jgi:hypothetical protein